MTNSINSISTMSASASYNVSAANSTRLSEATKKELEALGIDTSSIKTEAQGQALLKSVREQVAQKANQGTAEKSSEAQMRSELMSLAAQLGVIASELDDLEKILKALRTKLEKMKAEAVSDPEKAAKVSGYQAQYDSLEKKYTSSNSSQSVLSASMNNMAMMNKIFQKLA